MNYKMHQYKIIKLQYLKFIYYKNKILLGKYFLILKNNNIYQKNIPSFILLMIFLINTNLVFYFRKT